VVYVPTGSTAYEREMSTPPTLLQSMTLLYLYLYLDCVVMCSSCYFSLRVAALFTYIDILGRVQDAHFYHRTFFLALQKPIECTSNSYEKIPTVAENFGHVHL